LDPPPPHPAIPAPVSASNTSPAYAYPRRLEEGIFHKKNPYIAAHAANTQYTPGGTFGREGEGLSGSPNADMVVVSVAVSPAATFGPGAGFNVIVPVMGVDPFKNCTGALCNTPPAAPGASPLLCVDTVAVSVTMAPDVIDVGLAVTFVAVPACVIVTVSVGDVLPEKLLSPAYLATN